MKSYLNCIMRRMLAMGCTRPRVVWGAGLVPRLAPAWDGAALRVIPLTLSGVGLAPRLTPEEQEACQRCRARASG